MVRILVVDDEKRLAAGLKKGLEAEGFATDVALTGTDGLWMAREHPYDAIVLDIMLPGMNGYKVCSSLREGGNWTPIIMLTAKDGELDEAEALDTGADDFLSKPFSYIVLVARIRALLRRGGRERPSVLEVGDLRLDPARREVRRGDAHIDLSAKEFALLETLMRRPGEVLSRIELVEHAWDIAYELRSNVVDVYMRRLRRKLGDGAIETVRGAGYRLRADA